VDDKQRYVAHLLDRYRRLPGALGRVLRDDRRTAGCLFDQRIALDTVQQAFLIAVARRAAGPQPPQPIRSLRYFLPVVEEVLVAPPLDPGYRLYLQRKVADHHPSA
jgi:hypothetical protein